MSLKWPNSIIDNGILRKNEPFESKEDLLVFGYSCKLFRDDEKALYIDQGKHLIPWMGDESLKIDRYDCRGNMGSRELTAAESRLDYGVNWLQHLSPDEQRAERLCDEERYRALHTDEAEEEMYREEELKRLHMIARGSSYGQVGFNYDGDSNKKDHGEKASEKESAKVEDDEPYMPNPLLNVPEEMPIPESKKLNAIIEKTAVFIANQGTQMEILLKAKQAGNPQFDFLSLECPLHRYYMHLLSAIREKRYTPEDETQEENVPEKVEEDDHYLHPSLAPVSVESAPSIPSIAYKPSADCAYSMLVNQIKGKVGQNDSDVTGVEGIVENEDLAPPGTEVLPLPILKHPTSESLNSFSKMNAEQMRRYALHPFMVYNEAEITKAPVLYGKQPKEESKPKPVKVNKTPYIAETSQNLRQETQTQKIGGLKLIHYSDSDNESDSCDDSPQQSKFSVSQPSPDQQVIIDKMASYVAKNGDAFEQIVKMKGDPRFNFLNSEHKHYSYYKHKRTFYENVNKKAEMDTANNLEKNENGEESNKDGNDNKSKAPVSFSIKKIKEPEPILPKPALPYESSSDEEGTNETEATNKAATETCSKTSTVQSVEPINQNQITQQLPNVTIQPVLIQSVNTVVPKPVPPPKFDNRTIYHIQSDAQRIENRPVVETVVPAEMTQHKSKVPEKKYAAESREQVTDEVENVDRSHRDRKRKKRRHSRSRRRRQSNEEVVHIEDGPMDSTDFIDLTDDYNDSKCPVKKDRKNDDRDEPGRNDIQVERKRRAAAFLSSLKDNPTLATQQQSSLASAMVKTLNSYQSSRDVEDSKYRRKRRDESNRKKSKKHRRSSKERSYSSESDDENRKYERSSRSSKHHRGIKSRRSPEDERSSQSKSHRDDKNRSSPRNDRVSSLKDKASASESAKAKTAEDEYKMSRKQDKLLTTSLKQLVKEARKEFISSEPIKMAVDIFSDSPKMAGRRRTEEDEWERDTSSNDEKEDGDSKESSESGLLTSQTDDDY